MLNEIQLVIVCFAVSFNNSPWKKIKLESFTKQEKEASQKYKKSCTNLKGAMKKKLATSLGLRAGDFFIFLF